MHDIQRKAQAMQERIVQWRRALHAMPEVGFDTPGTERFIVEELQKMGVTEIRHGDGKKGIVALVQGKKPGGVLGIRADYDALHMTEETGLPFAATNGNMHACGHDAHAAILLGTANLLLDCADELAGTVKLIFQPSEEKHPCGALELIGEGVVDDVDSILALHCDPGVDVGHVGLKSGPITSATDPVRIQVRGAGGHTSRPHLTQDLVYALGSIATQLPAALTRRMDPRSGVNLTWGSIHAGSAFNAIPSAGTLEGTLRCLDHEAWDRAEQLLEEVLADLVRPWGVEARVTHDRGVPPVSNSPASVEVLAAAVRRVLGRENLDPTAQSLGGEDFAWYLEKVPGALARLGTRTPGGRTYDLRMGDLMIDERAIGIGASVLAVACVQRDLQTA